MPFYSGSELKLMRRSWGVTQAVIAAGMGIDQSRISHIEARAIVPVRTADRYLRALRAAQEATT